MSSRERRAANEAAYQAETEARERREAEYAERWKDLFDSLERAGINPHELKAWMEEN